MRSMKIALFTMLVFCGFSLFSQEKSFFKDVEIDCKFVNTPQIRADNIASLPCPSLAWWIEIDVKYKTAGTNKSNEWMDDVVFEYEMLLMTGKDEPVLLSGRITYWSIPMDGKEHHAVAFVHPRFVQRYAPALKVTSPSQAKDLNIRLAIKLNDALIGGALHPAKSKESKDKVADLFKKVAVAPKLTRIKDSIYGIDKTPWSYLNYDYYELIKIEGGK